MIKPVNSEVYPWINVEAADIPTVLVTLIDGTSVQYGSIVGLNGALTSMADKVAEQDSKSAQTVMFTGLPAILKGERHQGISRVENSRLKGATLFIASRNLARMTSLVFAVETSDDENVPPSILRAGSSRAKDLDKVIRMMGARPVGGGRRGT